MYLSEISEKYRDNIKKAALSLKNEGYKNIFPFGSLVTGKSHQNSDIDISITGLNLKKFFRKN